MDNQPEQGTEKRIRAHLEQMSTGGLSLNARRFGLPVPTYWHKVSEQTWRGGREATYTTRIDRAQLIDNMVEFVMSRLPAPTTYIHIGLA